MSLQEAKQFVAHFVTGDYTPEEYATFLRWLKGATEEELNAIADEHEASQEQWVDLSAQPSPEWVARLEQKLNSAKEGEVPVRRMSPGRFIRRKTWIAAASVVVLLSTGVYLYVREDGKVQQEGTQALKALSNITSNPRGGDQKELILADGSKVWLNAASSLKYPSSFDGPERVVELSWEAFFEVTKNSSMPFRVLIKDAEVEVLGTHFNVMAYDDEPISRTTLIEGAVRMESGSYNVVLKPGEQAQIPYPSPGVANPIKVVTGVNPDVALAWKNGYFQFENDNLQTVMRTLSRAYDVDIQFDSNVPEKRITGNFSRQAGLDRILEQLESLKIHFKSNGKTVRVTL